MSKAPPSNTAGDGGTKAFKGLFDQARKLWWERHHFDHIRWHELIWRVQAGGANTLDAEIIAKHLSLFDVAGIVRRTGGDVKCAEEIRACLHTIRRDRLAEYGFKENQPCGDKS